MYELPEKSSELRKALKKRLSMEVPELSWRTRRGVLVHWAKGYKNTGPKGWFEGARIDVAVAMNREGLGIRVNDPHYNEHGERIRYSADKGLFGPLQKVNLSKSY